MRGRKSHYQISRSGLIDREEKFRIYGVTGTCGIVEITSLKTWQTIRVSEPGGVCEAFEIMDFPGPIEASVIGMNNAIVMAEVTK